MSQLAVFEPPTPVSAHLTKIEADLTQVFRARPTEWLDPRAFHSVIEKHGVGLGLGHKPYSMQGRGLLENKQVYFGLDIGVIARARRITRGSGPSTSLHVKNS